LIPINSFSAEAARWKRRAPRVNPAEPQKPGKLSTDTPRIKKL